MTASIQPVPEALWRFVYDPDDFDAPPYPDFPYQIYAGRISPERYAEIMAWLRENASGRVIHNYDHYVTTARQAAGSDPDWHTVFAFKDERSAAMFKIFWAAPPLLRRNRRV